MSDIPIFNLSGIARLRASLFNRALLPHLAETLELHEMSRLVPQLVAILPAGVSRDAVFESVRPLCGIELTEPMLAELAGRLAGNVPKLRDGIPVFPWQSQVEEEWVPLHIRSCVPYRTQKNKVGYVFTFDVLAGSPCPGTITNFWQTTALRVIALHVGFSKFNGKYPFHEGTELVGLRLLAKLEPRLSKEKPGFFEVACPASIVTWNRNNVLKQRARITPCPFSFPHPCHRCAVGYDQCPAGTHPTTFVERMCQGCGEEHAFFDLTRNNARCVNCDVRERLQMNRARS